VSILQLHLVDEWEAQKKQYDYGWCITTLFFNNNPNKEKKTTDSIIYLHND